MENKKSPLELRFHTDPLKTRLSQEVEIIEKATKDETFRNALLKNPKSTIEKELGITLREKTNIKIIEESSNDVVIVLPFIMKNDDLEELKNFATESHLAANNTGQTAIQFHCCC